MATSEDNVFKHLKNTLVVVYGKSLLFWQGTLRSRHVLLREPPSAFPGRWFAAGVRAYFEEYLAETEGLVADDDQRVLYDHLKSTVGLGGKREKRGASSSSIQDKTGTTRTTWYSTTQHVPGIYNTPHHIITQHCAN